MNSSELTEMKEDWLANTAVTAFLGSLLMGQSWEWWAGSQSTTKLLTFVVPNYSGLVVLAMMIGMVVLSLFLAAASISTRLQHLGLRVARSASPILVPVVSTSFVISWLSSTLELPFDQWWWPFLFIAGFAMFIYVGIRIPATSLFRYLGRKMGRQPDPEPHNDAESGGMSDKEPGRPRAAKAYLERMPGFSGSARLTKSVKLWISMLVAVLTAGAVLVLVTVPLGALWDWLVGDESGSATVRNLGLVIVGLIAIPLAVWRALVAQDQAHSARHSMLNDRFQRGAEMLGSEALSVRTGGIYALQSLAEEDPVSYHVRVMQLFCAFARNPTQDAVIEFSAEGVKERDERMLRADVQEIMRVIGSRDPASICLERTQNFNLYLRGAELSNLQVLSARLSGAWLTKADLSGSVLPNADLSSARLRDANLTGATFRHADLSDARFWGADLSNAILRDANLSGADFCGVDAKSVAYQEPARGLTQGQLDDAWADPDNPPKLDGVLDADTGQQLIWRG